VYRCRTAEEGEAQVEKINDMVMMMTMEEKSNRFVLLYLMGGVLPYFLWWFRGGLVTSGERGWARERLGRKGL
jgi:hypothetical protein